ncbi:FGGY-family carbohydrate kinase [Paenibacillus pseudetheri]|uniref:Xylulose kinase n=1 Tax=Paenibacillus pseudetheri TaxID=2897682 RepID=A0ABM9BLA0_9BACL|nr:FGGY-family carbohydrate kinase [Paenibacillus pseudetheri]CAH1059807.1 Xylulose kinase [Paenibacillus pseudetheri]
MGDRYFIGIDGGSQSTKVLIINQNGEVVCSASEPLRAMVARKPGYVEHPDDDLWDSLKAATKRVMKKFQGDVRDIKGLGLCTIRCCRVFMKEDGTLAEPVMSWMDVRSYTTYEDSPEISYTCPTTGYITHRLTGELKDTSANAYQWQFPVDTDTWEWTKDEEHYRSFNIPKEKLLDLQLPGTILGYITEKAAEETGLPVGLPVVATGNDKAVEALGAGLIENNVGLISLGTYLTSMVFGEKNKQNPSNYWVNLSCVPYKYLYEGNGIRYGMAHVSWFKNALGEELAKRAEEEGCIVEDLLAAEAMKVPIGAEGLLTVPDWLAPADQLYRKGVFIGFDSRHTRGHMYRSILEGIALTLKNKYDDMINELNVKPQKIIISGGGSNSDLFMQIFADVFGVTTVRNVMNGAAGMGAVICAAVATEEYKSFEEAVKSMVAIKDEFTPNEENHEFYNRINEMAYQKLPDLMKQTLETVYSAFET